MRDWLPKADKKRTIPPLHDKTVRDWLPRANKKRTIPPLRDKTVRDWLPRADKNYLMVGQAPTLKGCSSGTLMVAPEAYKP